MLGSLFRRAVWATSVPPWLGLYRGLYACVVRAAVRLFRRYPAVQAVYLGGTVAQGEIVPLVSDLDFIVVTRGLDEAAERSLRRAYERLSHLTRMFDRSLSLYDEGAFLGIHELPRRQYWIAKGKATWRRLWGRDYLAEIPPLPASKIQSGLFEELKVWWAIFDDQVIQGSGRRDEPIPRNVVCYKAVSETLKFALALHGQELLFSRSEVLARAAPQLDSQDRACVLRLLELHRRGYHGGRRDVLESSKKLILNQLEALGRDLREHPLGRVLADVPQRIDASPSEWSHGPGERAHAERLVAHARKRCGQAYRGAHLATGAYFDLDEWLLMLEVDPDRLPAIADLRSLHGLHRSAPRSIRSSVHPYLLLPHVALQLDADYATKGWQSVLFPASNPEVFELLGRPESRLDGSPYRPPPCVAWTPLVADYVARRSARFLELVEDAERGRREDLVAMFWKAVQLVLIARSLARGEVAYPLTFPAIERALAVEGVQLPSGLEVLAEVCRNWLAGGKQALERRPAGAAAFVRELHAEAALSRGEGPGI